MNRKTKHFLIALAVRLILTSALVVSCYDNVAFRYETKYIEYKINQTICVENERIKCTSLSYHEESNEIKMYFENSGQEKESALVRMCEVADYISKYIKNNLFYAGKKSPLVLSPVTDWEIS